MILSDPKGIPRTKDEMDWAIYSDYIIPAFRGTELSVELLLDYVDLRLDWYTPSIESFKFVNFIRLCVGKEPENLNPKSHYFFIDCIFQSEEAKPYFDVRGMDFDDLKGNTLILSSREFSKSTLIAYLVLYMAVEGKLRGFGSVNFGMYVSDRMAGNVKTTMQTIEALYLGSEYLKSKFEDTHFTDGKVTMIRNPRSRNEIAEYNRTIRRGGKPTEVNGRMDRQFSMEGLGCSGGRGSKDVLQRPQFAIFDDMIANERDAYSAATLKSIDSTIEADVGSSLSGNSHFKIMIGTAYHTKDPVYRRVTSEAYLPIVFPKAEVPPHGDMFNNEGELIKPAMTEEEFVSVWNDRHSFEKQRKVYAIAEKAYRKGDSKPLKTINQEFYIRVTSEHERLIGERDIRWRNMSDIKASGKWLNWYITTDYTTTANVGSNNSGCFLWAIDDKNNKYLMDMSLRKMEIRPQYQNTLDMIKKARKFGADRVEVGVEVDGQQILHLMGLESYAKDIGCRDILLFAKQKTPDRKKSSWLGIKSKGSGDKLWRLKLVAPDFHSGKTFFNEELRYNNSDMETLLTEIKMTTAFEIKSSDDGLDCLSQVALMDTRASMYPLGKKEDVGMFYDGSSANSEYSSYYI